MEEKNKENVANVVAVEKKEDMGTKEKTAKKVYGYVRVSSKDQREDRQIIAIKNSGFKVEHIFVDKQSGKDFNRPEYKKMMKQLKKGDLLLVKSIDRLGRDYEEIMEQWKRISKKKGADIRVLDIPLLDTRGKSDDVTRIFLADLVLQTLSYVAQNERENIKGRQAEGIAAARLRGVRFGRKPIELGEMFYKAVEVYQGGEITLHHAARLAEMPYTTFRRKYMEYIEKNLV